MKWKVEYVTKESCNILMCDKEESVVGIGFPQALAERIVRLHNEALETLGGLK